MPLLLVKPKKSSTQILYIIVIPIDQMTVAPAIFTVPSMNYLQCWTILLQIDVPKDIPHIMTLFIPSFMKRLTKRTLISSKYPL